MKSTIAAEKSALRRAVREFYRTDLQKAERDRKLREAFLTLPEVTASDTLLLFYGAGNEPDTSPLLTALTAQGKTVALPRCLQVGQMEAVRYLGPEHLIPDSYGIPEPDRSCPIIPRDHLDLILVPNLLCDRRGYRLGHGGGYYDRYLAGFEGFSVSLCPAALLQDRIPTDRFDLPVRFVLTETAVLFFPKLKAERNLKSGSGA